jgi:alpha-tubulin suppressor-like RCC1 family protein
MGENLSGQVGAGFFGNPNNTSYSDNNPVVVPTAVVGLASGVSTVRAGDFHVCALTLVGGVKCWGANNSGQLGRGAGSTDLLRSAVPEDVMGLSSGVKSLSLAGNTSCAVLMDDSVKCWGVLVAAPQGVATYPGLAAVHTPASIPGLESGVRSVSVVAAGSGCALLKTGGVKCWGRQEILGNLAYSTGQWTAVDVRGLESGVLAISDRCALKVTGVVACWGGVTPNSPSTVNLEPIDGPQF